jgi:hypothetical protein
MDMLQITPTTISTGYRITTPTATRKAGEAAAVMV